MSLIDDLTAGNKRFVQTDWDPRDAELDTPPAKHLAVVACMDTRYNVEKVLGLNHGDAKVIRNAGNIVDDGTLRSLMIAIHRLDVKHVAVIGHTKCGMTQVGRGEFRVANHIHKTTNVPLHEVMRPDFQRWLGGIDDVEDNVRRGVTLLQNHPYVPRYVEVFGLIYDNANGRIRPVAVPPRPANPAVAGAPRPAATGARKR